MVCKNFTFKQSLHCIITLCLWFGLLLTGPSMFAQVTGTVTDAQTGDALIGASVVIQGTTVGTVTDLDGNYSINASTGDVLEFSYTGYSDQQMTVGADNVVHVMLSAGVTVDEIVITGYTSQSRRNVSGAVSSVEMEQLTTLPAGSVESALQGRVAGVQVATSGQPGAASRVRIRGFGTINNNEPLYVIDGLPVRGGIVELNPNDIKEMTVLKDASAASVYGARASNGVIIITTKNGSIAGKPTLTFDTYVGTQWAGSGPELIQDPLEWANFEYWIKPQNLGQPTGSPLFGNGSAPAMPAYIWPITPAGGSVDESTYAYAVDQAEYNGITRPAIGGTDWWDEVTQNALVQNYNLSITGGNETAQFALGVGHLNQEGTVIYTGYERSNLRANSLFRINDRLRVGENLTISYTKEKGSRRVAGTGTNLDWSYRHLSLFPVYDISGVNYSASKAISSASNNPVQDAFNDRDDLNSKIRALGSVFLEWDVLDNLTAKTSFSVDFANSDRRDLLRVAPNRAEPLLGNGNSRVTNQVLNWTWYNTLSYNNTFGDHEVNALVGTEAIDNSFNEFGAGRIQFLLEDLDFMVLNAGPTDGQTTSGVRFENSLFSVFGKVDYVFSGKYLLTATVRRDGSSRFGANNRFAVFPAFSVGWRISDENFFKSGFFDELKLRGGWGKTGNQEIDNLAQYTLYSTAEITTATYDIAGTNNSIRTGIQGTNIGNPDLKWEETTDINVGLDARMWNNRVNFSIDVYKRNTTDLLLPVPPSTLLGVVGNQFRNVGEMENRGVDISLGYTQNFGDLSLDMSVVASQYKNEIVALDPQIGFIQAGGFRSNNYTRTTVGDPISSFYGLNVLGIFETQGEVDAHPDGANKGVGRFKFEDVNNDGAINSEDRTFLGSGHPSLALGWNTNLNYKGFDFNMFWQGNFGQEIAELSRLFTDLQQFQGSRSVRVRNSFGLVPNSQATLPTYGTITAEENAPNSYYVQDGSYFRLKNISLGYTFGDRAVGKTGMSSLRLYLQANNIVTFTPYEGVDPENVFNGDNDNDLSLGLDGGNYPIPRSVQIGVTAKF